MDLSNNWRPCLSRTGPCFAARSRAVSTGRACGFAPLALAMLLPLFSQAAAWDLPQYRKVMFLFLKRFCHVVPYTKTCGPLHTSCCGGGCIQRMLQGYVFCWPHAACNFPGLIGPSISRYQHIERPAPRVGGRRAFDNGRIGRGGMPS